MQNSDDEKKTSLKLGTAAKEVLACLLSNADLTVPEISERTRLRPSVVQYQVQHLRERKLIAPVACIDVHRIGLAYFAIFFSLSADSSSARMLDSLIRDPSVAFVSEYAGAYRFGIGIFARSADQAWVKFSDLVQQSKTVVIRKSTATRTALYEVPRGYLSTRKHDAPFQISGFTQEVEKLSESETSLLAFLATVPVDSYREAARALGIPNTTFAQRLASLRRRGIFLRRFYSLDTELLGLLSYKVLIYVKGFDPKFVDRLRSLVLSHPQVNHFVESYGEWEFEANLEVAKATEISTFVELLYSRFPQQVAEVVPLPLVGSYKRQFFPGCKRRDSEST